METGQGIRLGYAICFQIARIGADVVPPDDAASIEFAIKVHFPRTNRTCTVVKDCYQ
jgi:hypothetical protein